MPKLCILTQYFPPEMGAPQTRLSELAAALQERGWEVEILTALPNYPTGKIFPGYHRWRVRRDIYRARKAPCSTTSHAAQEHGSSWSTSEIPVVRVPLWPTQDGFVPRLRMYFSFVASAMAFGPTHCIRPDLIWVESPPLFVGIAALYLAWRWKCPYVLNVSDLWPGSAIDMGIIRANGIATRAATWLEHLLYRRAAGITGQSTTIVQHIARTLNNKPMQVITNGVMLERFDVEKGTVPFSEKKGTVPLFVYAGLLGHAQGIDQILDLAESLPDTVPARFVLMGDGPLRAHIAQRIATSSATPRVRLLPPQPSAHIPALLAAADAAIITLGGTIHGAVPSKIYEAMAAGLPILLVATGEAAERVHQAQCGIVVQPGDLTGMRRALIQLVENPELRERMGRAGRHAAETTYNRQHIASQLDVFLHSVIA